MARLRPTFLSSILHGGLTIDTCTIQYFDDIEAQRCEWKVDVEMTVTAWNGNQTHHHLTPQCYGPFRILYPTLAQYRFCAKKLAHDLCELMMPTMP
jgi:hypothetical protein